MAASSVSPSSKKQDDKCIVFCEDLAREELTTCTTLLKRHPDCRSKVLSFLRKIKITMDTPVPEVVVKSKKQQVREKAGQTKKEQAAAAKAANASPSKRNSVPTTYSTLGGLSEKLLLVRVCPLVDPVAMSTGNINAMFAKGWKGPEKKAAMLEHIEFATGVSPAFCLSNGFDNFQTLGEHLASEAAQRGNRIASKVLPIDFAVAGVYSLTVHVDVEELEVRQRFTQQVIIFKAGELHVPIEDVTTCFLVNNYSEENAYIKYTNSDGVKSFNFCDNFSFRAPKRKAISDGEVTPGARVAAKRVRITQKSSPSTVSP